MIEVGAINRKFLTVGEPETALRMGSGTLPVLATPAMIALMEATASESIEGLLEPGKTSVGTKITVSHLSADPIGVTVMCESRLISAENGKYVFSITVSDRGGAVGEGVHERVAVSRDRFMEKVGAKRNVKRG